jgi:hypothetical protein
MFLRNAIRVEHKGSMEGDNYSLYRTFAHWVVLDPSDPLQLWVLPSDEYHVILMVQ